MAVRQARKVLLRERQQRLSLPASTLVPTRLYSSSSEEDEEEEGQQNRANASSQFFMGPFRNNQINSTLSWNTTASHSLRLMKVHSSHTATSLPLLTSGGRQAMWLSTTDKGADLTATAAAAAESSAINNHEDKQTYRERAADYGNQAKDGAKTISGMMKAYGPVFIGSYLTIYGITLGSLYLGVESGVMDPVTTLGYLTGNHEEARSSAVVVAELLEKYTITEPFADTVKQKPALANFAIAWVSTKFTEPFRLAATAAVVPRVARYFGRGTPPPEADPEVVSHTTRADDTLRKDDPKKP